MVPAFCMDVIAVIVACLVAPISGHGTGAPRSTCTTLTPGHGYAGHNTPYAVEIDNGVTSYSQGTAVTVTITGAAYQGVILQARRDDGSTTPVGTFTDFPSGTKSMTCQASGDTVTHSSTSSKNGVSYTWNPPSESHGNIKFVATVAESMNVWWKQHESAVLSAEGYDVTAPPVTDMPNTGSESNESDESDDSSEDQGDEDTSTEDPNGGVVTQASLLLLLIVALFMAPVLS